MKNRFLALLICAILVFSIIPFGKNIKASQTNNNAKQVNTPEQMAAVMREKANNNTARMKGKITQSQVNATIKQKLIVKTRDEIENTYGANSVYYYTVGNYQILFYDTAEEAKNACEKLKKDLPGTTIFQDIPITLKEAAKDNGSDEEFIAKKPDFIVSIDEISKSDIYESQRLQIPIVLIKRQLLEIDKMVDIDTRIDYEDEYVNESSQEVSQGRAYRLK